MRLRGRNNIGVLRIEGGPVNLTTVEKDVITALERSITKTPFDVGIRAIYLAETPAFNNSHKGALNGVLAQFILGSFLPVGSSYQ